jgi:signal peptidase II
MSRKALCAWLVPAVFAADRLLKHLALDRLVYGDSVPVWPGVFYLTLVRNRGAAFGTLSDSGPVLTAISVALSAAIAAYLIEAWRDRDAVWSDAALALVLGGALGNLFDRVRYGHVVDYLDFRVWPVFNLADACITAGVLGFAAACLRPRGT